MKRYRITNNEGRSLVMSEQDAMESETASMLMGAGPLFSALTIEIVA